VIFTQAIRDDYWIVPPEHRIDASVFGSMPRRIATLPSPAGEGDVLSAAAFDDDAEALGNETFLFRQREG
jgi:hypothetical protein